METIRLRLFMLRGRVYGVIENREDGEGIARTSVGVHSLSATNHQAGDPSARCASLGMTSSRMRGDARVRRQQRDAASVRGKRA
ncbi:MAG: hypothetical protein M3372_08370, partial [Verrucomicrobiota bacterium]|nr:hypothetical protein [Verrucomicrobiota bacterium]